MKKAEFNSDEQELVYNGTEYDVVKEEKTNNGFTFRCIADKEETTLNAALNEHINQHIASAKQKNNNKEKISDNDFAKIFTCQTYSCEVNSAAAKMLHHRQHYSLLAGESSQNTPPPRIS